MTGTPFSRADSSHVRMAALLLVDYGILLVLKSLGVQMSSDWLSPGYTRSFTGLAVTAFLAWGLMRRSRWAWYLALAASALWIVDEGYGLLHLAWSGALVILPSTLYIGLGLLSMALLGGALAALLAPGTRAEFHRR